MLRLKNITKAYEDNIVFNDAEISFPETGLILLYGHNGAGKSTLLSLISGNDINYQGSITIDDTIISNKNLDYYKEQELFRLAKSRDYLLHGESMRINQFYY